MPSRSRRRRHGLVAALLCAVMAAAGASTLQVAPTTLSLTAERRAEGLTLRNSGTEPVHAQVRVFRWTQSDGDDRLQPTTGLVASPPMLELAPGTEQLIRVVRTGPSPAAEEAYRVVVDELPLEQDSTARQPGVRLVLRYSIPVFVMPAGPAPTPLLHTRLSDDARGRFLEIENFGTGHAQVADLGLIDAHGQRQSIADGLSGYVLPGQRRRWPLPADLVMSSGSFEARINGEPDARELELAR